MGRRSRARAAALKALYLMEYNPMLPQEAVALVLELEGSGDDLKEFAGQLVASVHGHRREIDERLMAAADNWSLERMAVVDRNILRLGAAQLLFLGSEVPPKVAIDEAIELSKVFGQEESWRFVNGVLDRIYRDLNGRTRGEGN